MKTQEDRRLFSLNFSNVMWTSNASAELKKFMSLLYDCLFAYPPASRGPSIFLDRTLN